MTSLLFLFICLLLTLKTFAQVPSEILSFQGRFVFTNGRSPQLGSFVKVNISVISPDKRCLLYEETQILKITNDEGLFHLQIGDGRSSARSSLSAGEAFTNGIPLMGFQGCEYAPQPADNRFVRLSYREL